MRYVIMIYNANNCSTIDVQFINHFKKKFAQRRNNIDTENYAEIFTLK